jgi:hypothetical protein
MLVFFVGDSRASNGEMKSNLDLVAGATTIVGFDIVDDMVSSRSLGWELSPECGGVGDENGGGTVMLFGRE